MRKNVWIVAPLLLAVAACGTAEPGKDIAGNRVQPAASASAQPTTEESTEETTEDSAAQLPAEGAVPSFKLGEAAVAHKELDGSAGLITVSSPKVWRKPSSQIGDKPKHGRFLRLTVTASATTGVFGINPFEFAVVDAEGTRYQTGEGSAMTEMGDESLNDADLNPGEKIKGTLVFDVPPGNLTLSYAPMSQTLATWKLTVK